MKGGILLLAERETEKKRGREKGVEKQESYSNVMLVRIMSREQNSSCNEFAGEIVHLNLLKPVPYQGLAELVFRIEGIARFLNLQAEEKEYSPRECKMRYRPSESGTEYRSLGSGPGGRAGVLPDEYCRIVPTEQRAREGFGRGFHLKKAEDVVCVELLGRHYKSLQGRLRCKRTREQYVYFRSALELMYLFSEFSQDTREEPAID